MDGIKSI